MHNGPLSPGEQEEVALASSVPRAVLGGPSALRHDGLDLLDRRVHVVLPLGARRPSWPDARVHWSGELDERDVHPGRLPRRTRPARSVLDSASWSSEERFARWVVIAAIQGGITTTRHLREALTRRGPCRHRAVVLASVLDAGGGIQSLPERDFAAIWRAAGLPRPTRQRPVCGGGGRYFLDVWSDALGFGVEVHGIPHLAVERWDRDLERSNEIVICGDVQLAFSSFAVRRRPRDVGEQLLRMARARGWTGLPDWRLLPVPRGGRFPC